MSVAQNLETLHLLRRVGALGDAEFESAKARVLSAPGRLAATVTPPAAPASVPEAKAPKWVTWVVALVFLIGGSWVFLTQAEGKQATTNDAAADVLFPVSLRNEAENLPASSWKALELVLPYTGNLSVTVQVKSGNFVDVFLVDEQNLQRLKDNAPAQQFADFAATESLSYQRSAHVKQGTYYLVLRDCPLGSLSSSSSSIDVVAQLKP